MKRLKVVNMGDKVQGVKLHGDRSNPEPIYFRVEIPFGAVDITRTTDDEYWVHVKVNRPADGMHIEGETKLGRVKDARVDAHDRHAGEIDPGVLADPNLYHLAIRLGPDTEDADG